MARDYDEMEDDNPIEEDYHNNEQNECLQCTEPIEDGETFCSSRCETLYYNIHGSEEE